MYRYILLFLFYFISILCVHAQMYFIPEDSTYSHFNDTLQIQEVDIYSNNSKKYVVGSKIESLSDIQKIDTEDGSLANILTKYTSIYVKSDAGGLSSIRFRGTSPNHTSILVGGLNINSLTLGYSNASNVPVYIFDNIAIQFGSSSATNGSGSIGGNINLGFNNNWTNGFKAEIKGQLGSFGENMIGSKIFVGNGKIESITRFYRYNINNNFPFLNTAYYNWETKSYTRDTQRFASINQLSLVEQVNFKISQKQNITSFIWITKNKHNSQPNMSDNGNTAYTGDAPIEEKDFRSWVLYNNNVHPIHYYIGAGYVRDKQIDYSDKTQNIGTERLVSNIGINQKISKKIKYQAGIKYKYIIPNVYAYDDDISEQHLDANISFFQKWNKIKYTVNIRKQWVTHFKAPLTPALGLEYKLTSSNYTSLNAIGNIQKSYRIPTFNDRYWNQEGYSGNANLKPEDGMNYEGGIKFIWNKNNTLLKLNAQYFYMDIDNWIMWINKSSRWEASNVQRVISRGIELSEDFLFSVNQLNFELTTNYTFNKATRESSINETDVIGQQLIYTPEHTFNSSWTTSYNKYKLIISDRFIGTRRYNQINGILPSYNLVNISLGKDFNFNKNKFSILLKANNIFSKEYQNQNNYAMPEINYHFSIKYSIKQ